MKRNNENIYLYEMIDGDHEVEITPGYDESTQDKQPSSFILYPTCTTHLHEQRYVLCEKKQYFENTQVDQYETLVVLEGVGSKQKINTDNIEGDY